MKLLFVFLLMMGPVFSFARAMDGTDTLPPVPGRDFRRDTLSLPLLNKSIMLGETFRQQLPPIMKMDLRRESGIFLRPDHMPCRYPDLALVERMPVLRSANADRMPNGFRGENVRRFNGLVPPGRLLVPRP
jgi:hypothetical protein